MFGADKFYEVIIGLLRHLYVFDTKMFIYHWMNEASDLNTSSGIRHIHDKRKVMQVNAYNRISSFDIKK